jgi:hypothetical protein
MVSGLTTDLNRIGVVAEDRVASVEVELRGSLVGSSLMTGATKQEQTVMSEVAWRGQRGPLPEERLCVDSDARLDEPSKAYLLLKLLASAVWLFACGRGSDGAGEGGFERAASGARLAFLP